MSNSLSRVARGARQQRWLDALTSDGLPLVDVVSGDSRNGQSAVRSFDSLLLALHDEGVHVVASVTAPQEIVFAGWPVRRICCVFQVDEPDKRMSETCSNVGEDTCVSVKLNEEPDMRLGDICVWCACRECERCGFLIDLDCEKRVSDGQGYIDVCADCLTEDDKPYDQDIEGGPR